MNKIKALGRKIWSHIAPAFSLMNVNGILRGLLAGIACSFTLAGLTVALGPVGLIIGLAGTFAIGYLYQAFINGEAVGVRFFPTAILSFMVMPYFAIATGASLVFALMLTGGFIVGLDYLNTWQESLGRKATRAFATA